MSDLLFYNITCYSTIFVPHDKIIQIYIATILSNRQMHPFINYSETLKTYQTIANTFHKGIFYFPSITEWNFTIGYHAFQISTWISF